MTKTDRGAATAAFEATRALSERIGRISMNPIIRTLNQVRAMERTGVNLVNFSVGEPDFDTPLHIQDAAISAMRRGETRYTTTDGTAELKNAIQRKFKNENGLEYDTTQIGAASGAKQIIYNAFQCTLNDGDEVVIPTPYWTSYPDVVTLCDGTPITVVCAPDNGFKLQPEQLERTITPRTKWLILNSPSNPTGGVYTADDLRALADVLVRHPHVMIMSDDMYEHLLYDDAQHATMARMAPELFDRTLTVNGVSKTYAMTGWRIGYAGGPAPLIKAMAAIQSQATSSPCSISQAASVAALNGPQEVVHERNAIFQQRRDLMVERLNGIAGIRCGTPSGAFYCYVNCAPFIGKKTSDATVISSDTELAAYLLESGHVAVVQGAGFGLSPYLRLSYAASFEDIEEGCKRVRRALEALN